MSNDECRHLCGMLDGLAFLQVSDVSDGLQYLRTNIPNINDLDDLVTYFDRTSVSGCLRSTARSVGNQLNLVLRMTRPAVYSFHQTCERQRGNVGQPRAHQQRVRGFDRGFPQGGVLS